MRTKPCGDASSKSARSVIPRRHSRKKFWTRSTGEKQSKNATKRGVLVFCFLTSEDVDGLRKVATLKEVEAQGWPTILKREWPTT